MQLWKTASGLALVVLWAGSATALAQHHAGQHEKRGPQAKHVSKDAELPLCPVMGDPVDFNVKVDTDNGPIYFCCQSCVKKFKKNPAKYADKVAVQREALKHRPRVQVSCPLTGKPIDKTMFTEKGGEKVYFCCAGCKGKYEKNPSKFAGKVAASYTYQTRCPVTGDEIDPTVYTDLSTGQRIYFCCNGCEGKLLANPEKYAPKLAAQGINIDPAKLSANSAGKHAEDGRGHKGHDHP